MGRDDCEVWEKCCGDERGVYNLPASLYVGAWKVEKGIRCSGEWHDHWQFSGYAVDALERERQISCGGDLNIFFFFESLDVGAPIMTRQMYCGGECDVPCFP